ncbi:MAG: DNA polymerase III subunit alpha [Candidatus Paceibacterota bacterium]
MSKFVHLHTHSHYSLLNALPKIDDLIKEAKKNGMPALALTDNANLYGAIEFYKTCKKNEIKPIIGADMYVAARTRNDKQGGVDNRRSRLILLARDLDGYKNLIKLVTFANLEGFYYKPRIDKELIEKHKFGLICISPSFSGATSQALKNGDVAEAKRLVAWYKEVYGEKNFFLELTHHPEIEGHEELMKKVIALGKETNTPLVAAHDVYYLHQEDKKARDTLLLVNTNSDFSDRNSDSNEEDFSFITSEKAEELFRDTPEALENTLKIAEMCELELELGSWVFPDFKVISGLTPDEELKRLAYEGFAKRNLEQTKEYVDRLEYELKVIKDKGYSPYFLVVADLLRFAHENKILTNIRGSVAGSLTTYLTKITNVDPIDYKLPFERFLNPERPSAPDIDMDYADNRRDEVIEYAKKKYGADKVAQIGTFGTMMARGSVKDVARAMGYPYTLGDRISKLIPMGAQGFPMTIDRALKETKELQEMYNKEADVKIIIDMAKKIEGCARHISVHAAGVVMAPRPLTDFTPLQFDTKGEEKIITQYDMHAIEDAGLLKFDFLGIKNLAILSNAVALAKKIEGQEIDIENIPINDQKTFDLLARGETTGLFQLNGQGMTKYLKDLKPSTIHDINAMVALYRPGPIESIPEYIKRKHNSRTIRFLDPRMKDILSQSFGVITYQDDVMLIAIHLAGYSWLEADKLRKAMGKKIPKEMEAQKEKLKEGLIKKGMSQEKADELWALIEPFAAYGFNKAHAASYGRVAYQTAYMKANFPAIYMACVLTADAGDVEKIAEFIGDCKRMNIPVLPPNVNESFQDFTVVTTSPLTPLLKQGEGEKNDTIRFGLTTIKNFGEGIANTIIEERKKNGKFKDLSNFLTRIKDKNLNKKSLEALIKVGALDEFGERGVMMANVENMLTYSREAGQQSENQDSLFGAYVPGLNTDVNNFKLQDAPPATATEKLNWERELLGLYLSGHPLDKFRKIIEEKNYKISQVKTDPKEGKECVVAGMIEDIRAIVTKKGDNMAFLKLSDFNDTLETVVFPRTMTEFKNILVKDKAVAVKGKISLRNGEVSLIVDKVKELG